MEGFDATVATYRSRRRLRIMHEIHHHLVLVWNYEMNGDFAIDGVLR